MHIIDGYVCIARIMENLECKVLFGKGVRNGNQFYENLKSNGLIPYATREAARSGRISLVSRNDLCKTRVAKLHMDIAENEEDLDSLRNKKSLIIIASANQGDYLCGPWVEGKQQVIPSPGACAHIGDTDFKTFKTYDAAKQVADEFKRQGRMPATIGTFSLKYV